ncbi:hypothetical protein [Wolbachia endosymbiont (group A) of Calamotropha paludella]|uniref:hypothetical protein n=1 Tax=Wolbachia endosymbiont (group A) of Calamotropha paludella TaxID=2953989 RepID=UPI002231F5B4|nr:hypothetical protein [Wolbachia endosymbiont (group A) of Calamotropha paludella]
MLGEQSLCIFFDSFSSKFVEKLMLGIEEQDLLSKLRKSKERCLKYNIQDVYNIYTSVIKNEYQRIKQEPPSIGKPGYEDEIKQEPLSPTQIDVSKEEIMFSETIIVDEYRIDPVKQEQDLTDSEKRKAKDIKTIGVIKFSYLQLLEWLEQHISFFSDDLDNVLIKTNFLRWTEDLVIDKKKTAKLLIGSKLLDNYKSYGLACSYCLEDSIRELWGKELEEEKKRYCENKELSPLIRFWTLKMVGEEKEWAEENYEHLIKSLIEDGNEVAVEYLLDNLSKLERKPTINFVALAVTAASTSSLSRFYTYYTPVLLKLLGKMNSQERDRLYKERPYDVLTHLMNLKLERCDEMVEDVWKTRPPQPVCQTLLADIANQAAEGNSDSLQTFMEFWKKINETNEEIDRIGEQLLPYLFQFDEKEIREILDSATDNEKKKVVEYVKSDEGLTPEYCKPWLLNLVVTSCLGSGNEEGKKFMEDLISSGKGLEICTYLISNGKFEEFKKFFDTANGSDKFKKRLFTMRGNDIFVSLCMTKGKSIFDQFLSWYFCDENRESKFKQNLVLSGIGIGVIINTVLRSSGSNCTWKKVYQDKFIEWGGLKESEFIIKFQGEQRESMRRRNICVNLLFEQSSELVNEFLNCCFPDDGEKIDEFKKDFISGDKAVNFCVNKIEAEKLYAVKNFLDWIDLPEEEREKLLSRCKALLPGRHKDVETAFAKGNSEALLAEQECEKTEDYSNNNKKKRQRVSAGNTEPKGKRFVQSNSPESSMEEMKVEVALCQGNSTVREF